jgi:hypothetical protein
MNDRIQPKPEEEKPYPTVGFVLINRTRGILICTDTHAVVFGKRESAEKYLKSVKEPVAAEEADVGQMLHILLCGSTYALDTSAAVAWNAGVKAHPEPFRLFVKELPLLTPPKEGQLAILALKVEPEMRVAATLIAKAQQEEELRSN